MKDLISFQNGEAGDWKGLDSPAQVARYLTIGESLKKYNCKSVLDVGCGEAVLRAWLPEDAAYLGLEASALAVREAMKRDSAAKVIHEMAESFDPRGQRFDCIVFNEMLY